MSGTIIGCSMLTPAEAYASSATVRVHVHIGEYERRIQIPSSVVQLNNIYYIHIYINVYANICMPASILCPSLPECFSPIQLIFFLLGKYPATGHAFTQTLRSANSCHSTISFVYHTVAPHARTHAPTVASAGWSFHARVRAWVVV